jgi:hypothetical protein
VTCVYFMCPASYLARNGKDADSSAEIMHCNKKLGRLVHMNDEQEMAWM